MTAIGGVSYNGWPVLSSHTSGAYPRLRIFKIPEADRHFILRDGSAGFLIADFAYWWHKVIADIDKGIWDEWGYANRDVRGSSAVSNHASGTAGDINATKHPMGVPVKQTLLPQKIVRIQRRIRLYEGCLTWGGVWQRPDGMHVEISTGRTLKQVEAVARKRMDTPWGKMVLDKNPGLRGVILS